MGLRLRNFTGQKRIDARSNRVLKIPLRTAAAPTQPLRWGPPRPGTTMGVRPRTRSTCPASACTSETAQNPSHPSCCSRNDPGAPAPAVDPAARCCQIRMGIQRQVIGQQIDVMSKQQTQTLAQPPCHTAIVPPPEQSMVHQDFVSVAQRPLQSTPGWPSPRYDGSNDRFPSTCKARWDSSP